jgi:hypothetical protein
MNSSRATGNGLTAVLRWIARLLGLLAGLAQLLVLYLIFSEPHDFPLQEVPTLLCLLLALGGIGLSWFKEKRGGQLALFAGLATALSIFLVALLGHNGLQTALLAAAGYGLPGILVGSLYWLCAWREEHHASNPLTTGREKVEAGI